ncbi:MAG: ABC transporter permease [Bacteroidota bacterium]
MFRKNLIVSWRSFLRYWGFSVINVVGLGAGFGCCLLSLLFVKDELSYDNFHADSNNIFRITTDEINNDGQHTYTARSPKSIAFTIRENLPGVEAICTFFPRRPTAMRREDKLFYEGRILETDSNFFKVFTFVFVEGSEKNVFLNSQSIVLTKSASKKYFGTERAIGKAIHQEHKDYFVTAVIEDVPENSHFVFDMLTPIEEFHEGETDEWGNSNFYTYVRLYPGTSVDDFNTMLADEAKKYRPRGHDRYTLQPLTDIHLHSKLKDELGNNGSVATNYLTLTLAAFILMMATVNYINLATARALKRAREVGIRKASGATRTSIVLQFLSESLVATLCALAFTVICLPMLRSVFFQVSGKNLEIFASQAIPVWIAFILVAIVVGLLSGLYPALYLSHFQPAQVLKGTLPVTTGALRKILVSFQLTVAIALIFGTIVVIRQMDFVTKKDLGFDAENVLLISNAEWLEHREVLEDRIRQHAGVVAVGASTSAIGAYYWTGNIRSAGTTNDRLIGFCQINYEYFDALDMKLLEGRKFSPEHTSDTVNTLILNEQAVRELGLTDPIGSRLQWDADNTDTVLYAEVVGVVRDFHFQSLHEPIKPFAFLIRNNFFVQEDFTSRLFVRSTGDVETIAKVISHDWRTLVPERPFSYTTLRDSYSKLYEDESRFRRMFYALTSVAVLIVSLGLIALVSFIAEQRTKEIGIRKILGASVSSIVVLMNKDFFRLAAIALLIATPLSIYGMNLWLDTFAYRVDINGLTIILAALCSATIITIATLFQALRAARVNPAKSLKVEG